MGHQLKTLICKVYLFLSHFVEKNLYPAATTVTFPIGVTGSVALYLPKTANFGICKDVRPGIELCMPVLRLFHTPVTSFCFMAAKDEKNGKIISRNKETTQ